MGKGSIRGVTRGPYRKAGPGDGRRSPEYRALHADLAKRQKRDLDGKLGNLLESSELPAASTPTRPRGYEGLDAIPTDALEPGDLGAPILSRTSHDAHYVRATRQGSSLKLRNKQEAGGHMRAESAQDAPHIDLTSTRGIAEFDLGPDPLQPVPLSMKQVHPARAQRAQAHSASAEAILATIPKIHDHSGAAIRWANQNLLAQGIVDALQLNQPERAKIFAERLMRTGRISRAELLAYVSKHIA